MTRSLSSSWEAVYDQAPDTYTTDEMKEIINLFAIHIVDMYSLASKRFGVGLPHVTPAQLVNTWQKSMEQEVTPS